MERGKKGKKKERKERKGTEQQRLNRLRRARVQLKVQDRSKIKKIIASAITKYANEKIKTGTGPMKMNINEISKELLLKNGKAIGIDAVRKKFEKLDFNDEDILSLMSIVLTRNQIKKLNIQKPLRNEDKFPSAIYNEMNRYIKQNATMVEELQSENTPLGELIKIVLTEPIEDIQKDVRRMGLSPMELPEEEEPKGKEPKEPKEEEPKGKDDDGGDDDDDEPKK